MPHHPYRQWLGMAMSIHPIPRAELMSPLGTGGVKDMRLHIVPDFRENKGDARPCLLLPPSPGALKLPLGWI